VLVSVALAVLVVAVFGRTVTFGFVTYDDPLYVTENPMVQRGLDGEALRWAATAMAASNWHPLTWVSHQADWQLWGADAGGHHLTNVLLHAAAAVLLFLALRRMTGRLWPPALVAALFAVHPLRVESVAWIAERKDVLSGMLAMAVLLGWAWYAERPGPRRYAAVAVLLALGLAAKPMLVTLPLVLLLLDVWPLARVEPDRLAALAVDTDVRRRLVRLVLEKLPLLALAAAASLLTVLAQREAIGGIEELPIAVRFGNALVAWVAYVGTTVWPACLAVFYPHPVGGLPTWQPVAAAVLLSAATVGAVLQLRRRPWLAVGWFWYAGTLVPVIGLVQVGSQALADRYTYLPQVGLWIALAFTLAELVERRPATRNAVAAAAVAAVVAFAAAAAAQVDHWRSSEALYRRALSCTSRNWVAHTNLAEILIDQERFAEGAEHAATAVAANPDGPTGHLLLGNALMGLGRPAEAADEFRRAAGLDPDRMPAQYNLGVALEAAGDAAGAETAYRSALAADPRHEPARTDLGVLLLRRRAFDEAASVLCEPATAAVATPLLAYNCGLALAALERDAEALAPLRRAIALDPGHLPSRRTLGVVLERLGRREEAVAAFEEVLRRAPDDPASRRALASLRPPPTGGSSTPGGR
jgi:tetratricopeptide (TPR) repeat protein